MRLARRDHKGPRVQRVPVERRERQERQELWEPPVLKGRRGHRGRPASRHFRETSQVRRVPQWSLAFRAVPCHRPRLPMANRWRGTARPRRGLRRRSRARKGQPVQLGRRVRLVQPARQEQREQREERGPLVRKARRVHKGRRVYRRFPETSQGQRVHPWSLRFRAVRCLRPRLPVANLWRGTARPPTGLRRPSRGRRGRLAPRERLVHKGRPVFRRFLETSQARRVLR